MTVRLDRDPIAMERQPGGMADRCPTCKRIAARAIPEPGGILFICPGGHTFRVNPSEGRRHAERAG